MDNQLRLRRADANDCRFLHELRNDAEVRINSFHTEQIPYDRHCQWYEDRSQDDNTLIWILEKDGCAIGQVRLDIQASSHAAAQSDGKCDSQAEISYALCKEARGHGYAKWMLQEAERIAREMKRFRCLVAEVKRDNAISTHIFRRLGYREQEMEYGYRYEKRL